MSGADANTSFSDDQYDLAYPDGIEHHWWNRYRSGFIARLCAADDGANGVFLEVGCGKGGEVQQLRRAGLDISGVELAAVTPLPGVTDCIRSGVDANELPQAEREKVTAILLLDVIEHLPDPEEFLRGLGASYPNLSRVIITVPARQQIWSNYDEFYGHYRRYSLPMLSVLAAELGWQEERIGYFFQLLYIPVRLMSLLNVKRGTKITAPGEGARGVHRLVAALHRLEEWLLPARLPGTSAFAVLRVGADKTAA